MAKPKFPYLEQCADYISDINPEDLSQSIPGTEIDRGSRFAVSPLGKFALHKHEIFIAAKWAHGNVPNQSNRLLTEIKFLALLSKEAPELISFVPLFIGQVISSNNTRPLTLITEDVTQNGRLQIVSRPASEYVVSTLSESLRKYSGDGEVVDTEVLHETSSFRVNGQERLLDFTPLPVRLGSQAYDEAQEATMDYLESGNLTISISNESPLARSFLK